MPDSIHHLALRLSGKINFLSIKLAEPALLRVGIGLQVKCCSIHLLLIRDLMRINDSIINISRDLEILNDDYLNSIGAKMNSNGGSINPIDDYMGPIDDSGNPIDD
jgi:hypothetical protein